jgi:hypothetical protein
MTESPGAPTIEGTLHSGGGKGAVRMKCRYTTGIIDRRGWSILVRWTIGVARARQTRTDA